nr:unnamed protein product [Callosobruchus analis]
MAKGVHGRGQNDPSRLNALAFSPFPRLLSHSQLISRNRWRTHAVRTWMSL